MKLRRIVLTTILLALAMSTPASAYWANTGSGTGPGTVDNLTLPGISVPATSTGSTTITGTAGATYLISASQNTTLTYTIERRLGTGGTWAHVATGGCSVTLPYNGTGCTDNVATSGDYYYRAVGVTHTWTSTSPIVGPVTTDTVAPTVTVDQAATQTDPATSLPVHFSVVASEAVTGLTSGDVTLGGTADHTGATVAITSTDSSHYDIAVSGLVSDGTLTASLPAGALSDAVGNPSTASTSTDNTVTVNAILDAPTAVALTNGGGTGSVYVNAANTASVSVTLGANSQAADIVTLVASDGVIAHDVTSAKVATAGAGTVTYTALNLSGLTAGPITFTATTTDGFGHTHGVKVLSTTKDVTAPATPTALAFVNGLSATGTGTFISANNLTATQWTVTRPVSANNATTDTVTVKLTQGATTATGTLTPAGSASGNVSVNVDATPLIDGTVTRTATATDLAGNTSAAFTGTGTVTKDTVLPSAPSTTVSLFTYTRNSGTTADRITGASASMATIGDYGRIVESTPHTGLGFVYTSAVVPSTRAMPVTTVDAISTGGVTYVIYELDPAGNRSATGTTYTQATG